MVMKIGVLAWIGMQALHDGECSEVALDSLMFVAFHVSTHRAERMKTEQKVQGCCIMV